MNNKCNSKTNNKTGNNRRNGRQNKGNNRSYNKQIQSNEDVSRASNSVEDYAIDKQLLKDVASIPFSWAVGTPLNMNNELLYHLPNKGTFTIPGVCRLVLQPTVGHANKASDPINIAANRIYAYVRHANSGSKNYDAPDLMLYLIAVANVYGCMIQMQRALGTIGLYSVYNRYLPDVLLSAMGFDAGDLRANIANFRGRLNMLITKAASFAIPSNMPYFKNMVETLGNYYIEGGSMKNQLYVAYCPDFYFYQLNTDGSGMLKIKQNTVNTTTAWLEYAEDMLDRLVYSEDMNIMSGDILKAYGTEGIYKLATIPEDYTIMPLMDVPVLEQFKNATTVGMIANGMSVYDLDTDIKQEPQHAFLTSTCRITTKAIPSESPTKGNALALSLRTLAEDRLMTTMSKDVSPELVMESSKFMIAGDNYTHEPGSAVASLDLYPRNFIPLGFDLFYGDVQADQTIIWKETTYTYASPVNLTEIDTLAGLIRRHALLRNFKFAPAMHTLGYKQGSAEPAVSFAESEIFQDVDNYALISDSTLKSIHESI